MRAPEASFCRFVLLFVRAPPMLRSKGDLVQRMLTMIKISI
jgi:hypothetical protein